MFYAKNFICRLFESISFHFTQFTLKMCVVAQNREKFTKIPYLEGSKSFKVIDLDTTKNLVTSACFHKQDVCAYLQLFSC